MAELLRSTWAHVVDGKKIRRMSVAEIAAIQGFPAEWVNVDGITESERIAVLGNAVPPPLSHVLADLLKEKGAADYGLAQIRNYFVVMGIKGLSNTKAYAVLRKLSLYQSHHDPTIPAIGKKKWVTLGDLFYSKNYSA